MAPAAVGCKPMFSGLPRESVGLKNSAVAGVNELDREVPIRQVRFAGSGNWRRGEVIKRGEEPHGRAILGHQVLQQKEIYISPEVTKEAEEVRVSRDRGTQGAVCVDVV